MRACEARPATAKCGGEKRHKGRIARLVFCGTRPTEREGAVTVCYAMRQVPIINH